MRGGKSDGRAVGQIYSRSGNKKFAAEYDAKESRAHGERLRQSWAEKEYDKYVKKNVHVTSKTKKDSKKLRYFAIGRIAWKEGGGPLGWKNAVNIATDAIAVGGKWVKYDGKAKAPKYLYCQEGFDEEFAESWETHESWIKTQLKPTAQEGESGQASAADGKRKPSADATGDGEPPAKKAAKPKGKAAAKATTGGTAKTTTTPRKGGKAVESLATNIASAKKTKAA